MKTKSRSGLNLFLIIGFLLALTTGMLLSNFPTPFDQSTFWSLTRENWVEVHRIGGIGFMLVIIIHLVRNGRRYRFLSHQKSVQQSTGR